MSIYTGSNYGVISTANSGTGTLASSGNTTSFSYENTQNYTAGSVLLNLTTNGYATLNIYYANNASGTVSSTQSFKLTKIGSQTIDFIPQTAYVKVELVSNSSGAVGYTIQTKFNNTGSNITIPNVVATNNSFISTNAVAAGATLSGDWEDILNFATISILINASAASAPAPGTINCYFSSNGTNIDRAVSYPVQDATAYEATSTTSTAFNPAHTLITVSKYLKVEYTNGAVALTSLRLSTVYHVNPSKPLTSRATQFLTDYADADTSRSIINAKTEGTLLPGGHYQNIVASNGNLNIGIRDPISAFGELLNAPLTPFVQFDFSSGKPLDLIDIYQNFPATSSYFFTNSKAQINATGASLSKIELKSHQFTKYKPGQGCDNRFTARFPNGYIANCDQYAGLFTPEDSLTFGYFNGTSSFAIRRQYFGAQQINRFEITGNATLTSTLVLNFGGTTVNVSITNGDTPQIIAFKIWNAIQSPSLNNYGYNSRYYYLTAATTYYVNTVYNNATSTAITISITTNNTGSTISVTQVRAGITPSVEIIAQTNWNIDTCMDMGSLQANYIRNPSGFRLDPSKGNVFKIAFQYLGFGTITFFIEQTETDAIIPVHKIKYSNSNLDPSMRDPNLRIGIGINVTSATLTAPSIESASFSSFLQGNFFPTATFRSYGYTLISNTSTGLATTSRTNPAVLFGLKGISVYDSTNSDGTINYVVNNINLYLSSLNFSINAAANTTSNIIFMIIKNPTSVTINPSGAQNFRKVNDSLVLISDGVVVTNTTSLILTGGTIILEYALNENQNLIQNIVNLNIIMTPDDTFYCAFYGTTSGNADISGSLSYYVNM